MMGIRVLRKIAKRGCLKTFQISCLAVAGPWLVGRTFRTRPGLEQRGSCDTLTACWLELARRGGVKRRGMLSEIGGLVVVALFSVSCVVSASSLSAPPAPPQTSA